MNLESFLEVIKVNTQIEIRSFVMLYEGTLGNYLDKHPASIYTVVGVEVYDDGVMGIQVTT